jgi:hypothetical protein
MNVNGEVPMKHQARGSFITDDDADRMGAEMAIQFMLMTLFQIVSEMASDPRGFRADVHKDLAELVATYQLPPMPDRVAQRVRATAGKMLDGLMMRSWEESVLQ